MKYDWAKDKIELWFWITAMTAFDDLVYFYEAQTQYATWKKSDTEKHGLYNFIYIKCKGKAHL